MLKPQPGDQTTRPSDVKNECYQCGQSVNCMIRVGIIQVRYTLTPGSAQIAACHQQHSTQMWVKLFCHLEPQFLITFPFVTIYYKLGHNCFKWYELQIGTQLYCKCVLISKNLLQSGMLLQIWTHHWSACLYSKPGLVVLYWGQAYWYYITNKENRYWNWMLSIHQST